MIPSPTLAALTPFAIVDPQVVEVKFTEDIEGGGAASIKIPVKSNIEKSIKVITKLIKKKI